MFIRYRYRKGKFIIKIFGDNFVKNNKNKCKIIYNGKEQELKSYILIEENNDYEYIEINLIVYKEIINMSFMFKDCSSLVSLPDI